MCVLNAKPPKNFLTQLCTFYPNCAQSALFTPFWRKYVYFCQKVCTKVTFHLDIAKSCVLSAKKFPQLLNLPESGPPNRLVEASDALRGVRLESAVLSGALRPTGAPSLRYFMPLGTAAPGSTTKIGLSM